MNRHHLVPSSLRVLLAVSLLLAFVSIERSVAPPVALAATPVSISPGYIHTCGLKSDGTLACWGANGYGQAAPPTGSFTQVSAGNFHTCGVKSDGTLACWGANGYGQAAPPAGSFTQVSAGYIHTCGVKADGTIACWGDTSSGQATPPAGTFTQVSAGETHTCGVKSDGTIACWGANQYGQVTPPAGSFTQVTTGGYHTCGLKSDGTLACWGTNWYGQAAPPAGSFTQVSAGNGHSCGRKSDGTLACWGENNKGQATPPAGSFTQVDAGTSHTCGLRSDGTGVCWGDNGSGQTRSQVGISPANIPAVERGIVPPALSGAGGMGGPYTFTVFSGTLPTGLSLNSDGTWTWNNPAGAGDYSFDIKAIDKGGILGTVQHFTLRVLNTITAITNATSNPSTVGQSVQLQYTVIPLDGGTPTGNVTVAVVQEALEIYPDQRGVEPHLRSEGR